MTRRLRVGPGAALAGIAVLLALGCAPALAETEALNPCDPEASSPVVNRAQKARIPDALWERQPTWQVPIRFRIGADGAPEVVGTGRVDVLTTRAEGDEDRDALKQIAVDTLSGYRLCVPAHAKASDRWSATLYFAPATRVDAYMQTFIPEYARDEVRGNRQGKVVVRVRYATNGVPSKASVVQSSGDEVLDRKAVASMLGNILVTHNGLPLEKEYVFERPYTFEIR